MIKTIIFDIGGVVTSMNFDLLYANFAKRIGIDPQIVIKYHEVNMKDLILGKISFNDFCKEMVKVGGNTSLDFIEIWIEEANKIRVINHELLNIISSLRREYSVGVLSNLTESRYILDKSIGLYDNFDYSILSFKEHKEKPDLEFYKIIFGKVPVKPEEVIFIDDMEKNLIPASGLGMKTILYRDNIQLVEGLSKLGIHLNV